LIIQHSKEKQALFKFCKRIYIEISQNDTQKAEEFKHLHNLKTPIIFPDSPENLIVQG